MAPTNDADDIPPLDVSQFLKRAVRGKYYERFAPLTKKYALDLTEPSGERPTAGSLNGVGGQLAENWRLLRERLSRDWVPFAERSTVAVWGQKGDQSWPVGTGTLFRVADVSFLATASHVLRVHGTEGVGLFLIDTVPGAGWTVPMKGRRVVGHDRYDVVVAELTDEMVAGLTSRAFLNVRHTDRRNRRPAGGIFALHGFPCERSAETGPPRSGQVEAGPLTALARLYQGDTSVVPGYDPQAHLLLAYPPIGQRPDGTQFRAPDPAGLSGCSLWQVYCPGMWVQHWTVHSAAVVGIQTHADYHLGYIRGTRWWVVDQLIREGWPHLAPALSLEVPDPKPAAV